MKDQVRRELQRARNHIEQALDAIEAAEKQVEHDDEKRPERESRSGRRDPPPEGPGN